MHPQPKYPGISRSLSSLSQGLQVQGAFRGGRAVPTLERDMESQCSCACPAQIVLGGPKMSFNSSQQRSIQKGISSSALALAVLPLYMHLLKPTCHHPTASGRLDCLTQSCSVFHPVGPGDPLAARAASVHHCWLERMHTETQVQIEDSGHASHHTGSSGC